MLKTGYMAKTLLPALWALVLTVSCSIRLDEPGSSDIAKLTEETSLADGARVNLSLSVPGSAEGSTRSIDNITQRGSYAWFHGLKDISLTPYSVYGPIKPADHRNGMSIPIGNMPQSTTSATNYAYSYGDVLVPKRTASFLVYGTSFDDTSKGSDPASIAFKQRNGSLAASGLGGVYPNEITFTPEPIRASDAFPSEAATLATVLANVVDGIKNARLPAGNGNRTYNYVRPNSNTNRTTSFALTWSGMNANVNNNVRTIDAPLYKIYQDLFNESKVLPLSASAIENFISYIYRSLKNHVGVQMYYVYNNQNCALYTNNPRTNLATTALLRDQIISLMDAQTAYYTVGAGPDYPVTLTNAALRGFPENIGLPEGAMAVRYGNGTYSAVTDGTYTALSRYCYPPRLYYYANSQIKTSSSNQSSEYGSPGSVYTFDNWNSILGHYERDGASVQGNTASIAIKDPLQYGLGLFTVVLDRTAATIADASGANITVGTSNFPLTALIVGGQHQQAYNFRPIGTNALYSFDNDLYVNDSETKAYLSSSAASRSVSSLVLQTYDATSVYIVAEFRNDSGSAFVGAEGLVVPGARFYLTGKLDLNQASAAPGQSFDSVFLQDHETVATLRVTSLADVRNVIPDLKDPQLEVALSIDLEWKQATSVSYPLY